LHWNGAEKVEQNLGHFSDCFAHANAGGKASVEKDYSFKRYLQEGPARRFYLPGLEEERDRLRNFVAGRFPQWKNIAIEEADRLCQHRIDLLGFGEMQLGRNINWHQDPITNRVWPRCFGADYDLVHEVGAGDPKVVHELNRHQHLSRLAKAYFLT